MSDLSIDTFKNLKEQHDHTSRTINRTTLILLSFSLFCCFIAIRSDKSFFLETVTRNPINLETESLNHKSNSELVRVVKLFLTTLSNRQSKKIILPFLGIKMPGVTFLNVAPLFIFGLTIFLHVHFIHLKKLNLISVFREGETSKGRIRSEEKVPFFFNLPDRLSETMTLFLYYELAPVTLLYIGYRLYTLDSTWIPAGAAIIIGVWHIKSLLTLNLTLGRAIKILWVAPLVIVVLGAVGIISPFLRPIRKAKLANINLSGANLIRRDLMNFNLVGANLRRADLRQANLRRTILWGADFQDANLRRVDLRFATLQDANFQDATLQEANLERANLQEANLRGANLKRANLRGVSLLDAKLQNVNLQRANLRDASLRNVNLLGANLQGADLQNANLRSANLQGVNNQPGL